LLAFIVCDTVIVDQASQKKTLVGVFDQVNSPFAPFQISNLGLYAKLVEGSGAYEIKVGLVNLKDESPLIDMKMQVEWKNDGPLDLGMNIAGILLPTFGVYEFQLYADDVFLGRTVIRAERLELPVPGAGKR
jgi:hypothetical protein